MKKWVFLVGILTCVQLFCVDPWYSQKRRGWYYYEEKVSESELKQEPSPRKRTGEEAIEEIEAQKKRTHELLCQALLVPSQENVECYLKHQRKLIEQSAQFASTWKSVLMSNPDLSYSLPQTAYAMRIHKLKEELDREQRLDQIKQEHFLLYFFKGKDLFSQEASGVVSKLAQVGNWKLQCISLDGEGVEDLNEYELDQGLAQLVSLKEAPALYIVNPEKNYIIPVAFGLMDYENIEKNIDFQIQRKENARHAL